MKKFVGFTLSEMLIAMAVLSILIVTVLPAVRNNMPNQNKMMMKKAYYTTSDAVSEMINDTAMYPPMDSDGNRYIGFDNMEAVTINGTSYSGYGKFIGVFLSYINPHGTSNDYKNEDVSRQCALCKIAPAMLGTEEQNCSEACNEISPTQKHVAETCIKFSSDMAAMLSSYLTCSHTTTKDGMDWYINTAVNSIRTDEPRDKAAIILVDVNGEGKKPDCYQGSTETNCSGRTKDFDQFRMIIYNDGAIKIDDDDTWAAEVLTVGSSLN